MNNQNEKEQARKILLALDIASQSLAARDIALSLANRLQAELIALFIEDEDLLRSAQFPFASEIIASSAMERKLDYADMERSLRAWSTQMQQQLLKQAQQTNTKCTFRTFRGRKTETLFAQTETSSLLVFSGLRITHYPSARLAHTLYLLVDDHSDLQHSLTIVKQLISKDINHIVFIDSGSEQSGGKISAAIESLSKTGVHILAKKLNQNLSLELALMIKKLPAALVLVPGKHQLCQQMDTFKALQKNLACPMVVVN